MRLTDRDSQNVILHRDGVAGSRKRPFARTFAFKFLAVLAPTIVLANVLGHGLMAGMGVEEAQTEILYDLAVHTLLSTVATVLAVAVVSQRLLTTPLTRLVEAIRTNQFEGSRQAVDWSSQDEIGDLVVAFNDMQHRLSDGEARRRAFNERLVRFYNRAPAMLFSVDGEGTLIQVSENWLVSTGYARGEVIGRPLAGFLTPDSAATYEAEVLPHFLVHGDTPETPLRLRRRDGSVMDVVLSETTDQRIGGRYPLSLSVMSDISRTKAAERELVRLVLTDPGTGLANRRGFMEGLTQQIDALERAGRCGLAAVIDLDRFKRINDTHGHPAGDLLLATVARRLADNAGPGALVGRLGGDEFAIFLPFDPERRDPRAYGEGLLAEMRRPIALGPAEVEGFGSIGIAVFPHDGANAREILSAADLALYRAKEAGRNRVEVFDAGLAAALTLRAEREADIRAGLAGGWFELWIQPVFRLADGSIAGGEALLRMRHPTKGIVLPGEFIEVAEETGLIEPLGRFVLENALVLGPALDAASRDPNFFLSVNLSGGQVTPALPDMLADILYRTGCRPSSLVLEIIETAWLDDTDEQVNTIMQRVSDLGIRFALDDFGTGYSSLNYVQRFPVSLIKIDRSFTWAFGADSDPRIGALVRTMTTLGRELGLPIVAEGIESETERTRMAEAGATFGQGYHFAPPMPARAFLDLVAASRRPSRSAYETRAAG